MIFINIRFFENYLDWLSKTLKMNLDDIRKEIFSN